MVALAAAIVTIGFVLPAERAAQDRLYIRKIAATELPTLDGDASDAVWLSVKPLTVWTAFGGNLGGKGETKIEVRAVHDGERVYFCFIWDDPTRSLKHLPMIKSEDGWHVLQDRYDVADAHEYHEDKFAVLLTQLDIIAPVVAAATAALHRLDLGEPRLPESQHVLRHVQFVSNLADGAKCVWRLVQGHAPCVPNPQGQITSIWSN